MRFTGDRDTATELKQIASAFLAALAATCILAVAAPAGALAFGPLSSFGSFGEGAGQMQDEHGLAIGADGSAYVADLSNNRIDVFAPSGAFLRAFGGGVNATQTGNACTTESGCKKGLEDDAAASLNSPIAVVIDGAGLVYVADRKSNRIDVFTSEGAFVRAFGKGVSLDPSKPDVCTTEGGCKKGLASGAAGSISEPGGLGFGANGLLYVADSGENRIDAFSPDGVFVRAFGKEVNSVDKSGVCTAGDCQAGSADGSARAMVGPSDIKSGPGGQLAVADVGNNRIDVFSPDGAFLRAFGKEVDPLTQTNVCTTTCQAGKFDGSAESVPQPGALAVDGSGRIVVAFDEISRVSEFDFGGNFLRAFGEGVVDGTETFQICVPGERCQAGLPGMIPGAVASPDGVAVDCKGAIYVAEVGFDFARVERFGEPGTSPPPCPPTTGPGPGTKPSNKFRFGKLKLNRKKGTATLIAIVPGPGALVLSGKGIHRFKATAKKAGNVRLAIKLVGKAKRKLVKTGKAKVKAQARFTPTGGTSLTRARTLNLKKALG